MNNRTPDTPTPPDDTFVDSATSIRRAQKRVPYASKTEFKQEKRAVTARLPEALERERPVFVVDGLRTPFIKARGRGGLWSASDLATAAGRSLLLRHPITPGDLDQVILGCVTPAPDEVNIARVAALRLGCPVRTPAWTVQRNCASGMQAVDSAIRDIQSGHSDLVLAGGTEAMSRAPLLLRQPFTDWLGQFGRARHWHQKGRLLQRFQSRFLKPVVALLKGLTDPLDGLTMGQTAEILGRRFQITRRAMDTYAVASHHRLAAAMKADRFRQEIAPLFHVNGEVRATDDGLFARTSVERLARLKPVFDGPFGQVTAGNSAQITDGACWLLLAGEKAVKRFRLPVLGRVWPAWWAGLRPDQMGLGPVHAFAKLSKKTELQTDAVDYWEINEAFAAQTLACQTAMNDPDYCRTELGRDTPLGAIPDDRLNVDGGAISIGHPVGASGARILLHLLRTLGRTGKDLGVASLCIGGGQGGALLVQRT